MIYPKQKNEINILSENSPRNIEDDFVDEVCEIVIDALSVNHNEKRLVKSLLKKTIGNKLNKSYNEEGLLQQFEAYVLDTSIKHLKEELLISADVNHGKAIHAKFSSIVKEIKNKYLDKV